jgi:hypothetical protein
MSLLAIPVAAAVILFLTTLKSKLADKLED